MTMTLRGRWDTRLLLMTLLGVPSSYIFCWLYGDWRTPIVLLVYVLLLGLTWDPLYYWLQCRRWDRDWPPFLMVLTGVWEGILVWQLVQRGWLPGVSPELALWQFTLHYGAVFIITFLGMFILPIFSLHGRYHGGQWLDT